MLRALLVAGVVTAVLGAIVLPINLAAFPRLSRTAKGRPVGILPRVSIVIPARNEEEDVESAVRSHLAQDYPDFQVIVVDDRSTDRTPGILDALAREDARLTVIAGRDPPAGWLGKPHALYLGARAAGGELLLFADADVRYDPRALREAVTVLEDRRLDLLAFFPRFENRGFWENVLLPFLAIAVFLGFGFLALSRRIPLAMGAGAGNLVRRRAYDAVGGHSAIRGSVVDDVRLAVVVKRAGGRVAAFRAEDRVAVRMYQGFREVWNGFTKNVAWAYSGIGGAILFGLTFLLLAVAVAPAVVLAGAAAGAAIPASDVRLAAVLFVSTVLLRGVLAATLGDPIWPAATHPIMAAVWAGLIARSLFHRFIRRRLTWRGRDFDARSARS
ncbi:MAG: glycosyltransferase family 2 protein [Acidobacteriota bacterium]|nr:glycosyltransferase family 2 protein [Acidobacteriota bacterium]